MYMTSTKPIYSVSVHGGDNYPNGACDGYQTPGIRGGAC